MNPNCTKGLDTNIATKQAHTQILFKHFSRRNIPGAYSNNTESLFLYLLTLFLFKEHFHIAPTVAARSCFSDDLDAINWTRSSSPP